MLPTQTNRSLQSTSTGLNYTCHVHILYLVSLLTSTLSLLSSLKTVRVMGANYASYHCKLLDIWKQSIWKEKNKSEVYQYHVKWVQSSVIVIWSLQFACPSVLVVTLKTWRSGMRSPIAEKNRGILQDNHVCFNLLTGAFTVRRCSRKEQKTIFKEQVQWTTHQVTHGSLIRNSAPA